uniref:Uncharacterized protein n=1 Tax=Romanomermis culicivorax TaxID=13658 RepID=A0A915I0Y3_ROMCU
MVDGTMFEWAFLPRRTCYKKGEKENKQRKEKREQKKIKKANIKNLRGEEICCSDLSDPMKKWRYMKIQNT